MTNYICINGVIEEQDYEIYKYGFQTGLELLTCVITCLIAAVYLNSIKECIILLGLFFLQRAYAGGIHLQSFLSCYLLSCSVIILGIKFSAVSVLEPFVVLILITLMAVVIHRLAFFLTKKQCDLEETIYYRRQRRKMYVLIDILSVVFYIFGREQDMNLVFYAESVVLIAVALEICDKSK